MSEEFITIYVMGKQYKVPKDLTIMRAMEYAGYRFIRGSGCRGGFCGSCGTIFRLPNDYRIRVGLACQTVVQDGMYLTQIPFYPAQKARYKIGELKPTAEQILKLYPEVARCLSCNTCRKVCPQDLEVMEYVSAALRGDIAKVASLSFDCLMCGLCASRCPAEIVQYNVAILCRRLFGKYVAPQAEHLRKRVSEIQEGNFDKEIERLMNLDEETLKKMYEEREIEPD
ncbi:MAG: 4Fe-4S dicluster domain-containing protein [Candidatus Geothermarchaeales archaeon]